jgi:GH18 family chitinase
LFYCFGSNGTLLFPCRYDFFGTWSETVGVNAPLYDQDWGGEGAKDFSVDGCVRKWIAGGGSASAINIGLVRLRCTIAMASLF